MKRSGRYPGGRSRTALLVGRVEPLNREDRLLNVSSGLGERRGVEGSGGETGIEPKLPIGQAKRQKGVDLRVVVESCPVEFKSCLPDSANGRHRKRNAVAAVVFLGSVVRLMLRFRAPLLYSRWNARTALELL